MWQELEEAEWGVVPLIEMTLLLVKSIRFPMSAGRMVLPTLLTGVVDKPLAVGRILVLLS